MRKFVREVVYPEAQVHEESGKPPSQSVLTALAEMNIIGMRLGPGKHLEGRILMGGIVKPEEVSLPCEGSQWICTQRPIRHIQFDLFHECIIWQELARTHARGYNDGLGAGTTIGETIIAWCIVHGIQTWKITCPRASTCPEFWHRNLEKCYRRGYFIWKKIHMLSSHRGICWKRCCGDQMPCKAGRKWLDCKWNVCVVPCSYPNYSSPIDEVTSRKVRD